MTDKEEKAIERLKKYQKAVITEPTLIDAIETVLNLIEKQQIEIKDYGEEYNHWVHKAVTRAIELEKKDKIIDEMAKVLADYKYEEIICMEVDCEHIEMQNEGKCIGDEACIKEYFKKKVEDK